MQEIWKDIKEYEGLYQVSNLGRVKSTCGWNGKTYYKRDKILKPDSNKEYLRVSLIFKKRVKKYLVHRLVAQAFIPNPNNYPIVNHKDENPRNCKESNLEWCTQAYNMKYSRSKKIHQYDLQEKFVKEWDTVNDIIRETKITHICDCCKGKRKTAGGYIWRYAEVVR